MNHITNTAPALAIFDAAYSDFYHCFQYMGFDTVDQWSFEFEIGALNCSDVFKSFTAEQLQELYDVVHLNSFARAQIAEAWYCADARGMDAIKYARECDLEKYAREMAAIERDLEKHASEMDQLNNNMAAQLLRFKIMAMENMARATDSYAMDFTL